MKTQKRTPLNYKSKEWQNVSWNNYECHDEAWLRLVSIPTSARIFVVREGEAWYYLVNGIDNKHELPGVTNAEDAKAAADVMWRMG